MKKIIKQILLIVFIFTIGISSTFISSVKANSIAGLNCPASVNQGSNFTVSLILPSNAYSAESTVTVKYSDGTTSSQKIVYMSGMSDFPNSVSFNAKASGTATVTASNIIISDSSSNAIENGGSKTGTVNIVGANPAPTPDTTTTPAADNSNNNANAPANANFRGVNETVYATSKCNVRESYSTGSNKVGSLSAGSTVKRTGISDNGWSKVEFNGKTAYVSSQFLTTQKPADPTTKSVNETMYASQNCNLRKSWSTESDKAGYLTQGQEVTRIGVLDNGWSKIKYSGGEAYVATRLLVSEKPEETNETNTVDDQNVVDNTTIDNRTELQIIQDEVGVLPEVGRNVATYIYKIIALCAVVLSILLIKIYFKLNRNKDI